ncbi:MULTISPECIES: hypothetical protein [unclassified Streptomyces]|uniref:hypothetical protein n=1 Tax=unclassified Streptomyces TaxID=2593676 RepID=UPI000DBAB24B|nr:MULTISPECIES: hypothetical protein [unclassified Streptomyces]MYU05685.1 hypothetical protein [Streptomyces sp. SID8366]MYU66012.1 hypothetical protein [Streptomyces sp. SID69]RAJ63734.1 hypothetical protein K376_00829 [Streptomyces sp. PsTaAH-130]
MGFINNAKARGATDEARKAVAEGRTVLVYKFIEANKTSTTTAPMAGIGEQIEAVEAEGWRLDQMAAAESKTLSGERIGLVCLFRRRI